MEFFRHLRYELVRRQVWRSDGEINVNGSLRGDSGPSQGCVMMIKNGKMGWVGRDEQRTNVLHTRRNGINGRKVFSQHMR